MTEILAAICAVILTAIFGTVAYLATKLMETREKEIKNLSQEVSFLRKVLISNQANQIKLKNDINEAHKRIRGLNQKISELSG